MQCLLLKAGLCCAPQETQSFASRVVKGGEVGTMGFGVHLKEAQLLKGDNPDGSAWVEVECATM